MAELELLEAQPGRGGRGKQVFFLVMSGVVAAVVIFLLGVSVGRGVRKSGPPSDAGEAGDTTVAATPAARTAPADLTYHDALQGAPGGSDPAKPARPNPPATSSPPSTAPPPPVSDPPANPPAGAAARTPGQAPDKIPPPADRAGSSARTEYTVQVGAFSTLKSAQSLVAQVKAKDKSYPVSTFTAPESQPPRFKVVVGPYATLEDANRAAARLKKDGFGAIIKH